MPREFSRELVVTGVNNLTKREMPDRSKINMGVSWQVKCWTRKLGVSKSELQEVVDKVGNAAAAVRKELASR
jgi:Protein of unknown function (DUF3606)